MIAAGRERGGGGKASAQTQRNQRVRYQENEDHTLNKSIPLSERKVCEGREERKKREKRSICHTHTERDPPTMESVCAFVFILLLLPRSQPHILGFIILEQRRRHWQKMSLLALRLSFAIAHYYTVATVCVHSYTDTDLQNGVVVAATAVAASSSPSKGNEREREEMCIP